MTQAASHLRATVFIPTYNGEKYIGDILKSLFRQEVNYAYEVYIIDSGSTDGTLDTIRKYQKKHKNLRLKEIDNSDFGHGKTRNLAAQESDAEFMVYLSHDAIPANKHWLYEILKPFELHEKIVAVVGKQKARPKCVPILKYEIRSVFRSLGPDHGTTISYKDSFMKNPAFLDSVSYYSDVASATRRDFLLNEIPYRDVPYAEDYMFGRDLIEAGYMKAYASRAVVVHSNDLSFTEYKHRIFDETVGIRKMGVHIKKPRFRSMLKAVTLGSLADGVRIFFDREYSFKRKVFWLLANPFYHVEKWRGIRLAVSHTLGDEDLHRRYSLESRRKK